MVDEIIRIKNGELYSDEYMDIDTNEKHNLLIYKYSINEYNYNIVIGELLNKEEELTATIDKIIKLKVYNFSQIFVSSFINEVIKNRMFENINFSQEGYDLIFSMDNIGKHLNNVLRTTVICPTTKEFSCTTKYELPFNNFEFYDSEIYNKRLEFKRVSNI